MSEIPDIVEKYLKILEKFIEAAFSENEDEYDRFGDELDVLWYSMSKEERKLCEDLGPE